MLLFWDLGYSNTRWKVYTFTKEKWLTYKLYIDRYLFLMD